MPIFQIAKSKLKKIKAKSLPKEQDLQTLIGQNLNEVLDIDFLASEYVTSFGGRIDTLGIDKSGSPVIIEFKRSSKDNVINQGLSYLRWLLDHKAEFELLVSKRLNNKIKIDWTQPRVICIAESYNKFDLDTVDILPIKIELLKYKIYENDTLLIEPESYAKVRVPTGEIIRQGKKKRVEALQKEYSLDRHLGKRSENIKKLFYALREEILALGGVTEKVTKFYIVYKTTRNFAEIIVQSQNLLVNLDVDIKELKRSKLKLEDCSKIGHWATGDTRFRIYSLDQISDAMDLIKQSYELTL